MQNIDLAKAYLEHVSKSSDVPEHEIKKNREMNENIYVKNLWDLETLFKQYIKHFKQPVQLTRQIKGPIGQVRLIETLNEHYKDYTFKPKISQKSRKIEEKKRKEAMQKLSFSKPPGDESIPGETSKLLLTHRQSGS